MSLKQSFIECVLLLIFGKGEGLECYCPGYLPSSLTTAIFCTSMHVHCLHIYHSMHNNNIGVDVGFVCTN